MFLGDVSLCATPPSARASPDLCDQSCAHWNPPFQNPRSATVPVAMCIPISISKEKASHNTSAIQKRYDQSCFQ